MVKPSFAIALALACTIAAANGLQCHQYLNSNGAMQHTKVTCRTQHTKCYKIENNQGIVTKAGCESEDWCRKNKQATCCSNGDFCNGNGRTCLKTSWGSTKKENCFNQETLCKSTDVISESADGCATKEECNSAISETIENMQCCNPVNGAYDCNKFREKSFKCYDDRPVLHGTGEEALIVTCKATKYNFIEKEVDEGEQCAIGTWNDTTVGMGCWNVEECERYKNAGHQGCCAKNLCNEGNEHLPKLTIMIMTFFLVYLSY